MGVNGLMCLILNLHKAGGTEKVQGKEKGAGEKEKRIENWELGNTKKWEA